MRHILALLDEPTNLRNTQLRNCLSKLVQDLALKTFSRRFQNLVRDEDRSCFHTDICTTMEKQVGLVRQILPTQSGNDTGHG
jgi:hypothetical protein